MFYYTTTRRYERKRQRDRDRETERQRETERNREPINKYKQEHEPIVVCKLLDD